MGVLDDSNSPLLLHGPQAYRAIILAAGEDGYCWSFYSHATPLLSLCRILHAHGPATTAYAKHHVRHFGVDQHCLAFSGDMAEDSAAWYRIERRVKPHGRHDPHPSCTVCRPAACQPSMPPSTFMTWE